MRLVNVLIFLNNSYFYIKYVPCYMTKGRIYVFFTNSKFGTEPVHTVHTLDSV